MSNIRILWADDEIEMLKPQILFLEEKGYRSSGSKQRTGCNRPVHRPSGGSDLPG